jgi:hypothetical protein
MIAEIDPRPLSGIETGRCLSQTQMTPNCREKTLDSIPMCRLQSLSCTEPVLRLAVQDRVGDGVQGGTEECLKQDPSAKNAIRVSNFGFGAPRRGIHCGRHNGRS